MTVRINGQDREVPDNATVADVVRLAGLEKAAVAAEVNRKLVPKRDHDAVRLREGDEIELVSLVGGG